MRAARAAVAAAAVALTASPLVPAEAAVQQRTVTGPTRTYEVRVPAHAVLRPTDIHVTTTGRYAVAYVERAGARDVFGMVEHVPFFPPSRQDMAWGPARLSSGDAGTPFRLVVVTDRVATVTFTVSAVGPVRVLPAAQVPVKAVAVDLAATPASGIDLRNRIVGRFPDLPARRLVTFVSVRYVAPLVETPAALAFCHAEATATACPDEPENFGLEPKFPPPAIEAAILGARTDGSLAAFVTYAGYQRPAALPVLVVALRLP